MLYSIPHSWIERGNHFIIFLSGGKEFVDALPPIPDKKEAKKDKQNHGKFSILFKGGKPFNTPVHRAAYWGSRRDYLNEKPKIDLDPTVVLQYLMLTVKSYRLLIL